MTIRVLVRKKSDRANLHLYYVHPLTRREVSKDSGTSDKRDAAKVAGVWEAELNQHFGADNDGWKHFRDRFREEHLMGLAANTLVSYTSALNTFANLMKPSRLADIDASTLSVFRSRLTDAGFRIATVRNYMQHTSSALNWAQRVGMIREAPLVMLPRIPNQHFMRGRPMTEKEYRLMLKTSPEDWRRFLELLWLSGLRITEALILSWDRPPIVLDLAAQPYPQILFYAEGHKSRRDEASPMARDFYDWLLKTPPRQRCGLVAPVPIKTRSAASHFISGIGEAASIVVNDKGKFASAHDFRRSFGTRWAPHVMPLTLQRMMRHSDISTTMRFYVNLSTADFGREIWSVPNLVPKNGSARHSSNGRHARNTTKSAAKHARKRR